MRVPEISVTELKARIDAGEKPFVLDVRQPQEYALANLGATLIPLGELPQRLNELEGHKDDELLVVHCRSGARSAQAAQYMRSMGYKGATNLKGGIIAWNREIDPSIPAH